MIIKIEKEKLIEPLKNLVGVAEKKQTMPILGNILFRAANGKLLIVGSDLEVEISTLVNHQTDEDLNTTLPGKKLLDILRSLPGDGAVTIELGDDKATIKSGKSRFVLASLPGSDFPYDKEDVDYCYEVSAHNLDNLINQTSFSMAVQDARHFLNGMFFEVGAEKITVVATDGHRLSMSACNQTNSLNEPVDCIIPRKCITEIKRILSDFKDSKEKLVNFNIKSNHFYFSVDDYFVKSKLIEGNYPDYNKVFPESLPHKLDVDKKELKSALQRMSILSNEQFKGVKLSLSSSETKLSTNNPSQEEGEDSISCIYSGENLDIGFNLTYLIEVIDVISSENIVLQLNNSDSGCLISSNDNNALNKYIIMPMRV